MDMIEVEHKTEDIVVGLINPENFREIHKIIEKSGQRDSMSVQVIDQVVHGVVPVWEEEEEKKVEVV